MDITGEPYVREYCCRIVASVQNTHLCMHSHYATHACTHSHTQFMEDMIARYDEQAREAGVYIVFSCGFGSIPNDMGALLLQRTFNGELAYIESYMTAHNGVSKMIGSSVVTHRCVQSLSHSPCTFT